jgi:hypothetical protein
MDVTKYGIDMGTVLKLVASIVTALLGLLAAKMQRSKADADAAAADKSRADLALLRLGTIGVAMLGRAWDRLSPLVQAALADGKITAEERAAIEAAVKGLLSEFTSEDELAEIGRALGLPMAGIIAKIASFLIDRWTQAHDPTVPTVSAKAFPVGADPFEGGQAAGGGG